MSLMNSSNDLNYLKSPISKELLSSEECQIFMNSHGINIKDHSVYVSYRCYINHNMFHSLGYSIKGNSNSYLVHYIDSKNKKENYCVILKYFLFKNEIYSVIQRFDEDNSYNLLFENNRHFYIFVNIEHFKDYFVLIDKKKFFLDIINIKNIRCKCIMIENECLSFISKIQYDFEHD